MQTARPTRLLSAFVALLALLPHPSAQASEPSVIRYTVSLPERQAHRVSVRMSLEGLSGDTLELAMPVWTPGSYLVREYARHVLSLDARTADGRELLVDKPSKDAWRVYTGGAGSVTVRYELYANEVSVRTSHVTSDHAYLQPAATFLRHAPSADAPLRVELEAPEGWAVFTGLRPEDGGFLADDYDQLVDCPIEVGPHDEIAFEVHGVPHRLVLAGRAELDHDALRDDVARLCTEVAAVFGNMPFDDYTFIISLVDNGGGGLEHMNSSVCMTNRWSIAEPDRYRRFLALVAHEYFHAWNVKRFRPAALGPFDYSRENYTPDLWVAEGITSYYDDLCTLRAGFAEKVGAYLADRANAFRTELDRPGAARMSLAQASRDAWIKHYRPDENSPNAAVSYYTKGALVALMLDLRLRRLSGGARSLADVLRLGWERYTARGVGFPPGAFEALTSELADADLAGFFDDYVRGTRPLEPDVDLAWVGLQLLVEPQDTPRPLPRDEQGFALEPWLGISTRGADGLARIDLVREDGPAFQAGLNHDDVLLAVDAMRVDPDSLQDRLDRTGGQPVTLTFWRGQELRTLTLQPESRRLERWSLASVDNPSPEQLAAFHAWCGWDHPATTTDTTSDETDERQAGAGG